MTGQSWAALLVVAAAAAAVVALVAVRVERVAAGASIANRDVKRLQQTLDSLAETTHDWLWRTDRYGRFTYSSAACLPLLGYRPEQLVGMDAFLLVDAAERPFWRRRVRSLGRLGRGWCDETVRMRHVEGFLVAVESSAAPVLGDNGRAVGFQGTARPLPADRLLAESLASKREQVEQVLSSGAVRIAFQPIVCLATGAMVGVEALARIGRDLGHDTDGIDKRLHLTDDYQPPDVWIRQAMDVGLGVALELKALQSALDAIAVLPPRLYVSINASPRTIADPRFLELLLTHGTPLNRLVLEITEHESVADYAPLTQILDYVRSLGLRLAIDDAGSGYASFRHILTLRPDYIKLDRDLTAGIDSDPARRALASAVVMFALELDAVVTAEGVETEAELETLRTLSVDAAQGFYLARPSTDASDWTRWSCSRLFETVDVQEARPVAALA